MSNYVRQSVLALDAYEPGEQPDDPGVVKLNTNENPYPPSPRVREALTALSAEDLRRYPDPVCRRLREQVADLHGCRPEQVFVGNGSDEVLALCLRAFVEPEGTVGFFQPSYSLYPVLAAIEDVIAQPVPLGADFGWNMPDRYRVSLFFLTNPNAPTGMLFPRPEVTAFCRASDGVVLIDEAYVDFARADRLDLALSLDNVLVARSLSKSYSLAGLRLGYAVGPAELIGALYKIKDSYNVGWVAQNIAGAALADVDHMRENVSRIVRSRERAARALSERGFKVFPSEANFLWVSPPDARALQWFEALRARHILVRHFPGDCTGSHLRITVGTDADMDRLLAAADSLARGGEAG